jgi:hypothetical protein
MWTHNKISRTAKVNKQLDIIIEFITNSKKQYSLKKAQQIAGYLNYYLAIAGRSIYKIVTFFLHNFNNFYNYKQFWSLAIRKLLHINDMYYNKNLTKQQCSHITPIHVDASLTHAALVDLTNEFTLIESANYNAPIYVGEIHAAFMGPRYILEQHTAQPSTSRSYQLFTDNNIVYYLLQRGRAKIQLINQQFLLNLITFFTLINNFINIGTFFVPSKDNKADRFRRLV